MPGKRLGDELKKKGAFRSPKQEAIVNLMRTHDKVQIRFARLFREHGLTMPQYNVLRILRGEGTPLPVSEIAARTIAVVPGMTRVIDRLVEQQLVSRCQCDRDRRVWWVQITAAGKRLLRKLDSPLNQLEDDVCCQLTDTEAKQLGRLLDKLRCPMEEE